MREKIHCRFLSSIRNANKSTKSKKQLSTTLQLMKIIAVITFVFTLQANASIDGRNVGINKHKVSLKGNVLAPATLSFQQDRVITGKVVDSEDDSPVPGVSVRVKGDQTSGTITSADGTFTLKVKNSDKVLVFTSIGYVAKEQALGALIRYDISLAKDSKQLNEVVIAFGTSSKAELTNSVTKISAKDIEQRPITNLNSAIAGAAPGVQSNAGSGQPGEGPEIRIRGFGSITGDNSPLYVLDGAPYEGVISNINPEDIDNISILKDASATALYGSRGANGVILITTKKGSSTGKATITAKLTQAFSTRGLPNYETLDAYDYFPVVWEALRNRTLGTSVNPVDSLNAARGATNGLISYVGWNPFNVADDEIVLTNGALNPDARLLYPDDLSFGKELKRVARRTDMSLAASGGGAKTNHYVSVNYLDDKGYVKGSDFQRFSSRLRVNTEATDWLSLGLNLFANYTKTDQANESSGLNENPFYVDLILAPIYPVYKHDPLTGAYVLDQNGNKVYDPGDYRPLFAGRNVVYETMYNINQHRRSSLNGVGDVAVKIFKGLKFTSNLSFNLGNFRNVAYDNSVMGDAVGVGRTTRINSTTSFLNFNQLLNYTRGFNGHKITALFGHESYWSYYDYLRGVKRTEGIEGLDAFDNMSTTTGLGSYDRDYKTEGYFTKLDYSYRSKYLFSGSFRYDGSSRFNPNVRWGKFWSVSGAYNINKEDFFKVKWIDDLKLRASYGQVGNDRTGNYFSYMTLYTLGYDNGSDPGMMFSQLGNNNLKWETNYNADIALEFSMFKNRIGATLEVFRRQTKDLLFDVNMPLTSGVLSKDDNVGSMRNEGIELQLNGVPIKGRSFRWSVDINATTFRNEILSLPNSYIGRQNGTKRYDVGRSLYEFYLDDFVAVNPATGANLYRPAADKTGNVNYNGEMLTSTSDNALIHFTGSAIPDVYGSINNSFSYKSWSLQFLLMYQIGGQTYDNDYQTLMFRGSSSSATNGRAMHVDMLNRWKKPGDMTDINKVTAGSSYVSQSDRWLIDADYLNLRTVALTYNFPKPFLSKLKLTNAKAYVNGENIFITSKRKGLDPTQTYTGSPSYTYAPARVISLGLNLTF